MRALHLAGDDRPEYVIHIDPAYDLRVAGLLLDERAADIDDSESERREVVNGQRIAEFDGILRARMRELAQRDDVTVYLAADDEVHLCTETDGEAERSREGLLWQEAQDTTPLSWTGSG